MLNLTSKSIFKYKIIYFPFFPLTKKLFSNYEIEMVNIFLNFKVQFSRVLYGSNPLKNKNPNSKATFKNITKLVRLETGGKGRR